MAHPFPFFGAGDASYFEWASVYVRFARDPTSRERTRIEKGVPAPLRDAVQWEDGRQLMVASGQFAHATIAETYEADPGDEDDDPSGDEDDDGRFFFAATSQVRRFNEHIERWLHEAHAICPILAVFRAEDSESGGTELSEWHSWSVRQTKGLLPELAAILDSGDDGLAAYLARGILETGRGKLSDEWLDRLDPERTIGRALDAGDLSDALTPPTRRRLLALAKQLDTGNAAHRRAVRPLVPALLVHPDSPTELLLEALAWDADADVPEPLTTHQANRWAVAGLALAQKQRFAGARRVFRRVVDRSDLERTAYCNALFALQNADGSPVDAVELDHILGACLPHGKKNPAIFLNAAGAVIARGDREGCLGYLAKARKHGLDLGPYRSLPAFRPVADDPRYVALFAGR